MHRSTHHLRPVVAYGRSRMVAAAIGQGFRRRLFAGSYGACGAMGRTPNGTGQHRPYISKQTVVKALAAGKAMSNLYDSDFSAWVAQQVKFLRERRFDELDLAHVIDELEGVANQEKRSLRDGLVLLMKHRLKQEYLPQGSLDNWCSEVSVQQAIMRSILKDNPGLQPVAEKEFPALYQEARFHAAGESGTDEVAFPAAPPWTLGDVLAGKV